MIMTPSATRKLPQFGILGYTLAVLAVVAVLIRPRPSIIPVITVLRTFSVPKLVMRMMVMCQAGDEGACAAVVGSG